MGKIVLLYPTPATQIALRQYCLTNNFMLTADFDGETIPAENFDFHITLIASEDEGVGVVGGMYPLPPFVVKPAHLGNIGAHDTPAIFCLRTRELQELRDYFETTHQLRPTFDSFLPHISLSYHPANKAKSFRDIPLPDFRLVFDRYVVKDFAPSMTEALAVPFSEIMRYQNEGKAVLGQLLRYLEQKWRPSAYNIGEPFIIHGQSLGMTGYLGTITDPMTFFFTGHSSEQGGSMSPRGAMTLNDMTTEYRKDDVRSPTAYFYWRDNPPYVKATVGSVENYGKLIARRLRARSDIFIHEWTHHRQFTRDRSTQIDWSGYINYRSDGRNRKYYNHPGEVEAYISTILRKLDHNFVHDLSSLHASPSVEQIIDQATNNTRRFWDSLTPANKRDVKNAILPAYRRLAKAFATQKIARKRIEYSIPDETWKEILILVDGQRIGKLELDTLSVRGTCRITLQSFGSAILHSLATSKWFVEAYHKLCEKFNIQPNTVWINLYNCRHNLVTTKLLRDTFDGITGRGKKHEITMRPKDSRKTVIMGIVSSRDEDIAAIARVESYFDTIYDSVFSAAGKRHDSPKVFAAAINDLIKYEQTIDPERLYREYGKHYSDAGDLASFKARLDTANRKGDLVALPFSHARNMK
jgi:hypothetical protein